jgi:type 1 glutamine amidotransferase
MTNILLVADGVFHPPLRAGRHLKQIISTIPGAALDQTRHLNDLAEVDCAKYQALVLYYHHKTIGREALARFAQFVNDGGGVLAIHSATASFKKEERYGQILGGRFAGHGPVEIFELQPSQENDRLLGDVGRFAVKDELYLHDMQPDVRVLYTAQHKGNAQPVVWTRREGAGRVCYIGPGHRTQTMKQPQIEQLLRGGTVWAIGEEPS